MKQTITFTPLEAIRGLLIEPFIPARAALPEWYKSMPHLFEGAETEGLADQSSQAVNRTVKGCQPFMDAMTTGYMLRLSTDVEVRLHAAGSGLQYKWRTDGEFVSLHGAEQHPGMPPAVGSVGQVAKWANPFHIHVPDGYSVLFSHPFNRTELPFRTMTGVVDCDRYVLPVQFPFEFIGALNGPGDRVIVERGTPIVQLLPFRRESWQHKIGPYDAEESDKRRFTHFSRILRSYRTQAWSRKAYE